MSLLIVMVITVALSSTTLSSTIPSQSAEQSTESSVETFDSYAVQKLPEQLPLTIQLPREGPGVPFYSSQPEIYLRPPQYNSNPQPDFYQVPVPSEYLIAPTEGEWNPNNDPNLYYELPASITKENIPTNQYPKKFNKDLHTKSKPLSSAPKQEIALEPINEAQYIQKQKALYKVLESLNKKENQKSIEKEKVPIRSYKPRIQQTNTFKKPKDNVLNQTKQQTKPPKILQKPYSPTTNRPWKKAEFKMPADSSNSETTFGQNIDDSDPEDSDSQKFTKGLSPQITDSLGLTTKHDANGGKPERLLFHMVGHDGPMSYKWGYDTGKGHNRQFRYEERDKEGIVRGQFGYYDNEGKFRMMNYDAHPEHGFHMEAAPESDFKE